MARVLWWDAIPAHLVHPPGPEQEDVARSGPCSHEIGGRLELVHGYGPLLERVDGLARGLPEAGEIQEYAPGDHPHRQPGMDTELDGLGRVPRLDPPEEAVPAGAEMPKGVPLTGGLRVQVDELVFDHRRAKGVHPVLQPGPTVEWGIGLIEGQGQVDALALDHFGQRRQAAFGSEPVQGAELSVGPDLPGVADIGSGELGQLVVAGLCGDVIGPPSGSWRSRPSGRRR